MITVEETSGIFGMTVKGTMSTEEIDHLFAVLQAKVNAQPNRKIRMYARLVDFSGWDGFESFIHTMKGKMGAIGKIEKYAILTDYDWIEAIAKVGDFFTPGIDVKTFDLDELEKAIYWLKQGTKEETLALTELDTGAPDIVGFAIDGVLSKADYTLMNQRFEDQLRDIDHIRLYLEFVDLDGMTLQGIWEDFRITFKFYGKIRKIVLAGDDDLVGAAKFSNFITPGITIKYYHPKDREEALDWLSR